MLRSYWCINKIHHDFDKVELYDPDTKNVWLNFTILLFTIVYHHLRMIFMEQM